MPPSRRRTRRAASAARRPGTRARRPPRRIEEARREKPGSTTRARYPERLEFGYVSSVPKGPKNRGFSLVELMNFLALAALLATLGMYGFAYYVRRAKTAEAVGNVTAVAQAAAAYYNESDAHQPAGTKPEQAKAMRHFPAPARQTVPADPSAVKGKKYQSAIGDW